MSTWQVHAVKYSDRTARTRRESLLFDPNHDRPHPIDFFVWVLRRGEEVILVDTGFDQAEADRRAMPSTVRNPAAVLEPLGLTAAAITRVIVTHLHFDHAGGLHLFPNATLHLQAAEMAYATGPCMCEPSLGRTYTGAHVCEAVKRLFAGQVVFHDGDGEVAEGVTVHRTGGHSRGMQAVRVRTEAGWLVLASDATHFYENIWTRVPFPIVVDLEEMLKGFTRLESLASSRRLIVPGHDPLVRAWFPEDLGPGIHRLDRGPTGDFGY
jgi:glyoxylase-like metal-dependent hydrolase (beta-lactamase superfamily II)